VLIQQVLERYNMLARNMSLRIQTAEQALQQLQRRQASFRKSGDSSQPVPGAAGDAAGSAARPAEPAGADAGAGGGSSGGGEDEEEETDEERQRRQEEEEKEQRTLIEYNEATKSFRRWRPDFKCGNRVPLLPDGEVVECEPGGEAPCCSNLGWCGKSSEHCTCDLCSDYRSGAEVKFKGIKLAAEQRECETIAHNMGNLASPKACAELAVPHIECGRAVMFSHKYPQWGCRCCGAGTGAGLEEKPYWTVYTIEVDVNLVKPAT